MSDSRALTLSLLLALAPAAALGAAAGAKKPAPKKPPEPPPPTTWTAYMRSLGRNDNGRWIARELKLDPQLRTLDTAAFAALLERQKSISDVAAFSKSDAYGQIGELYKAVASHLKDSLLPRLREATPAVPLPKARALYAELALAEKILGRLSEDHLPMELRVELSSAAARLEERLGEAGAGLLRVQVDATLRTSPEEAAQLGDRLARGESAASPRNPASRSPSAAGPASAPAGQSPAPSSVPAKSRFASLALGSAGLPLVFSSPRELDYADLPEGTVAVDIGRKSGLSPDYQKDGKAILDHHHLPRGRSATELVYEMKDALAAGRERLRQVQTHADPDLDAIVAAMLVNALKAEGRLPEGIKPLVDYVTAWNSGKLSVKPEEMSRSLGMALQGLLKTAEEEATAEVLEQLNRLNLGEAPETEFLAAFSERADALKAARVSRFLSRLLESGYDLAARQGRLERAEVPDLLKPRYDAALAKIKEELGFFTKDASAASSQRFWMTLPSEAAGVETQPLQMLAAHNPESAFTDYLFASGILGGVIYEDNLERVDGRPNRHFRPEPRLKGSQAVVAVSEHSGLTLSGGLAGFLAGQEAAARDKAGLPRKPKDGRGFWEEQAAGRRLRATEGTVFTRKELIDLLAGFRP